MKIAFEKKIPDVRALSSLSRSKVLDERYIRLLKEGAGVIAAYDGDKLIGIGGFQRSTSDAEAAEEWAAWVDPHYANRDIESNMIRLLQGSGPSARKAKENG